jgi:hypothetical protein
MENDSTLREVKTDMDKGIRGVMPESWDGHGRMAIRRSDAIPRHIESKAIDKMSNLSAEKEATPERIAKLLIEELSERES